MTGELNEFGASIEATVARQRLADQHQSELAAKKRRARIDERNREKTVKEARLLRKQNHEGTDPKVLFGSGASVLCDQFLGYMREMDFAGSIELKDPANKSPLGRFFGRYVSGAARPYSIRAYPIARTWNQDDRNVFLCEDGKVRQRMKDGTLEEFALDSKGKPVDGATTSYRKSERIFLYMSESNRAGAEQPVYRTDIITVDQTLEEVLTGIALAQRRQQPDSQNL